MTESTPDPRELAVLDAAAGILHQPEDAVLYGLLDELELDDTGNVDPRQAAWLIDRLATDKPYLVIADALPAPRKSVDFDAGARKRPPPPPLTVTERLRRFLEFGRRPLDEDSIELLSPRFAAGENPNS